MTNILEHTIFRYTWELVRHTYLVDLESEIEIRQVEVSPSHENRLLDPPYPFTSFFEIEIDQIQKNGTTVFSFRNICPVEINRKPAWNLLKSLLRIGSSRVTKRFQSQEGETEIRWLYTDDFFLISLSSSDRHELSMLLSQILGKLNMIALSSQSGRRIRSEFENQQKYRAAMSTMFSEGVDGAFRDVPVYQQHGEGTGGMPAGSIPGESVPVEPVSAGRVTTGRGTKEYTPAWSILEESIPLEGAAAGDSPAEPVRADTAPAESLPGENAGLAGVPAEGAGAEYGPDGGISPEQVMVEDTGPEHGPAARAREEYVLSDSILAESVPVEGGTAEYILSDSILAEENTPEATVDAGSAPAPSGPPTDADAGTEPSRPRPADKLVIDVKSVEELQDLSWLSD